MEIFQTIWTALTTPNEELINYTVIFFSLLEVTVVMLLFTTILNITASLKQKFIYVLTISTASTILNYLLPDLAAPLNMLLLIFLKVKIFNISFLKSIFAEIITFFSVILSETLFLKIYLEIFNITAEIANTTPIYRISFALIIYSFIFILYRLAKHFNFNITLLDNMNTKNKILLSISFILGITTIFIQNYVNSYYMDLLPSYIIILSTFALLAFFVISVYSISKTTELDVTSQSLEESQLYNKSLKILHDNVRAFKHDFSNIVQAIGRLC